MIEERLYGLRYLKLKEFDVTIDFICSGAQDVEDVYDNLDPGLYILISSVWLAKKDVNEKSIPVLSQITENYLASKMSAEAAVVRKRNQGFLATSLRLPVQSGINDHTGRILFYLNRIVDTSGLILVNGGLNRFQIVNNEDVALALTKALLLNVLGSSPLWDAMPHHSISIKQMIHIIAGNRRVRTFDVSSKDLAKILPEYLECEPFWQEYPLTMLENNIFNVSGVIPREIESWILPLLNLTVPIKDSILRQKEISLINDIKEFALN